MLNLDERDLFDVANIYQFITFRLHDSVPAEVIEQWKQELHWHEEITADSKEAAELRRRIEKYADSGKGACYLRNEPIARLVQNALKHFDDERYRLIAWCIMPNHVHISCKIRWLARLENLDQANPSASEENQPSLIPAPLDRASPKPLAYCQAGIIHREP